MCRTAPNVPSLLISEIIAGSSRFIDPSLFRLKIDARSNLKPSTCISSTQKRRLSTIILRTAGCAERSTLPAPVSLR